MADRSTRNTRPLILLLGALTAIAPFSTDVYLPALPDVARSLSISTAVALQTVSIFYIGMAIGQLVHGPLSDRWGRKPLLMAGLGTYFIASLGCALAYGGTDLILWRVLQAIGGCAGVVIARAVARDRFEHGEMLRVLAFLVIVMSISPLVAPFCGGWLLLFLGWRAIFVVQAAIGVVLLLSVWLMLSESRSPEIRDLARTENPLKSYASLLGDRSLHPYLIAACAPTAGLFCWVASSAIIVIDDFGVAPIHLGYIFAINGGGLALGNYVNIQLARRWKAERILVSTSMFSVTVSLVLFTSAWTGAGGLLGILIPIFLLVSTLAFAQTNAIAGALAAHPLRAGSVSALFGSGMYFAGAAAAAVAGWAGDGSALATASVIVVVSIVAAVNAVLGFRAKKIPATQVGGF